MKTRRFSFTVTDQVGLRLDHLIRAGLHGSTHSEVVRRIVEGYLLNEFKARTATEMIDWSEYVGQKGGAE